MSNADRSPFGASNSELFTPMSVGQILDRTFRLYRQHFLRYITIIAIIQVPMSILGVGQGLINNYAQQMMLAAPGDPTMIFSALGLTLLSLFAFMGIIISASILSAGALTKYISEAYLGHEPTVGEVYSFVWSRFGSLLGATLLIGLATSLGYFFCIVPGVIFSLWWALTTVAIVVEGVGSLDGMSRSKSLVSGNLGKVFLVALVSILITSAINIVPTVIAVYVAKYFAETGQASLGVVLQQLISLPGGILAGPVFSSTVVLLYYDLRIRKEGFDLDMLAQSMGSVRSPQRSF